jgi:hypothetical protein
VHLSLFECPMPLVSNVSAFTIPLTVTRSPGVQVPVRSSVSSHSIVRGMRPLSTSFGSRTTSCSLRNHIQTCSFYTINQLIIDVFNLIFCHSTTFVMKCFCRGAKAFELQCLLAQRVGCLYLPSLSASCLK